MRGASRSFGFMDRIPTTFSSAAVKATMYVSFDNNANERKGSRAKYPALALSECRQAQYSRGVHGFQ
jgi:hypothetical protein